MTTAASRRLVDLAAWTPVLGLILIPLAAFLTMSLWRLEDGEIVRELTLDNYHRFLSDAVFLPVFGRTCLLALGVALITLVVGYPCALWLVSLAGRARLLMTLAFAVPLLMSYIIKIYAIRALLGGNGFLNAVLQGLGLVTTPVTAFMFNLTAVLITLAILLLPFTILPIVLALERIPGRLLEASADLGAPFGRTFRHVIWPLSRQGALVGAAFTFVLALGDFVTPQMVGGPGGLTFGRIVYSQFGLAYNWPFGAALSVILALAVLLVLALTAALARPRAVG